MLNTAKQVNKQTPPTFLVTTADDKGVPPQNSMDFYQAMFLNGIPGELHSWEKGGHGYGILPGKDVTAEWPVRLHKWMTNHGWAK
jgi:dipeptidyl aminopeptidase/acylaminoacyl peptidase